MGKLSPEDRATYERLKKAHEAPDDEEDFVIWVRNSGGHETRLTGDTARDWCRRNNYTADEAEESEEGEPLPAKKSAAKKAAPGARKAKSGDVVEEDEEEEAAPAPDAQPKRRGNFF